MELGRAAVGVFAAFGLVTLGALFLSALVPGLSLEPVADSFDVMRCRAPEQAFGLSGTATPLEQQFPVVLLRTHCRVTFELTVESIVGALEVRVRGPSGTIYEADVVGFDTGAGPGVPLEHVERASESEVAPGSYVVQFRASGQAVFRLEGWAEPMP